MLPSLVVAVLSGNLFEGTFPEIVRSPLFILFVDNNAALSGTLPTQLWFVKYVSLCNTSLCGGLPASWRGGPLLPLYFCVPSTMIASTLLRLESLLLIPDDAFGSLASQNWTLPTCGADNIPRSSPGNNWVSTVGGGLTADATAVGISGVSSITSPALALTARRVSLFPILAATCRYPTAAGLGASAATHVLYLRLQGTVDAFSAPLQLAFGPAAGASHRGAIVGNVSLCCGLCLVAAVVVYIESRRRMCLSNAKRTADAPRCPPPTVGDVMSRFRLPGGIFLVFALLLQQTIVSSVLLISAHGGDVSGPAAEDLGSWRAQDWSLVVVNFLVLLVAIFAVALVLDPRPSCFYAKAEAAKSPPPLVGTYLPKLFWLAGASTQWRDKRTSSSPKYLPSNGSFVGCYGLLFTGCRQRRHWWLLLELAETVTLSVFAGIVPNSAAACAAIQWIAVCISVASLAAALKLQPKHRRLSQFSACFTHGTQLVVALCVALGADAETVSLLVTIFGAVSTFISISQLVLILLLDKCVSSAQEEKEEQQRRKRCSLVHKNGQRMQRLADPWLHVAQPSPLSPLSQISAPQHCGSSASPPTTTLRSAFTLPAPQHVWTPGEHLRKLVRMVCDAKVHESDRHAELL